MADPPSSPPPLLDDLMDTEDQELPELLDTPPVTVPRFTFQLSSDPLNLSPRPDFDVPSAKRKTFTGPARPRKVFCHNSDRLSQEPHISAPQKSASQDLQELHHTVESAIFKARDLILLASTLAKNRKEQSRLLDLLHIFREYTETGHLIKASNIITTQIANLESATRQIGQKARDLSKGHAKTPSPPATNTSKPSNTVSFAEIAKSTTPATRAKDGSTTRQKPQEWTIVEGSKSAGKTVAALKNPKMRIDNRVTLIQEILLPSGFIPGFSPLALRNAFNKAFQEKGIKEPVVSTVTRSFIGHVVVTTTPKFNADYLLEKQSIWAGIIPFVRAQKPQDWYKVTAHGIPTSDFNSEEGMALILDEISTFNKGYTTIGTPYWLTSAERRRNQRAGSIVVSFTTQEQADRAIKNGLNIAGISVSVRKYHPTSSTTQCTKCGDFGHLYNFCKKKMYKCLLCGDSHATEQHHCSICNTKGKRCMHLVPSCINCKGNHTSTEHAKCEVYQVLKRPQAAVNPTPETMDSNTNYEL